MKTVEAIMLTALGVTLAYVVLNAPRTAEVIKAIAGGTSQFFATLQGRGTA